MIIDHLLELAKNQSLSAAKESDYTVDFGQKAPTTGMDELQMVMVFQVTADVTGNLTFAIQHSDQEASGFTDAVVSGQLTAPKAGTMVVLPMPYSHKRYVRANFGGAPTAGKVNAFITHGFDMNVPPEQAPSIQTLYP